jgi:hypothetical protein
MEKLFIARTHSASDLGLLARIDLYKLNKSQGPSRYAYETVKQVGPPPPITFTRHPSNVLAMVSQSCLF